MGLFDGFDLGKILSGDDNGNSGGGGMLSSLMGGGMGSGIMNMLMKQLASRKTQKMIETKSLDVFDFLAARMSKKLGRTVLRKEVSILSKVETVPVLPELDENGRILIEEAEAKVGLLDKPEPEQKLEDKTIIYVYVGSKAEEKTTMMDLFALMQPGMMQPS